MPRSFASVGALIVAASFVALGALLLRDGHPHEDAYILFKYVRNLGDGHGISYFPGGPRTEGATDFLWLLLLTALYRIGFEPEWGALAANGCGVALVSYLILRLGPTALPLRQSWPLAVGALLALSLPFGRAALVGFSSALFGAAALLLYVAYTCGTRGAILSLPLLGVLTGLLRPDGVVLGVAFALLGLRPAREIRELRRYLLVSLGALAIGVAYLAWRYSYFGTALPLPLYVKSHGEGLFPSGGFTVRWLIALNGKYLLVLFLLVLLMLKERIALAPRLLIGLAPALLHLGVLALSEQSQNIGFRFQTPFALTVYFLVLKLLARWLLPFGPFWRNAAAALFLVLLAATDLSYTRDVWRDATRDDYVNRFAARLETALPAESTIALTEAGRLAYRTKARVYDLVGLNTAETALRPPSTATLAELAPAIVMFNHAGTLELPPEARHRFSGDDVVELEELAPALASLVIPRYRPFFESPPDRYGPGIPSHAELAPLVAAKFLDENRESYQVLFVRYEGEFAHVYGIRRGIRGAAAVRNALVASNSDE